MPGRGQGSAAKGQSIDRLQRHRPAHQCVVGHSGAHRRRQAVAIRADQQVLSVVQIERPAGEAQRDPAGPPADLRRAVQQGDGKPGFGQAQGSGQAGPAGADHDDRRTAIDRVQAHRRTGIDRVQASSGMRGTRALTKVRQASQNLRSGVSETRWRSTWKPSSSISVSRVA